MLKRWNMFDALIIVLLLLVSTICLIPLVNTVAISFSDRDSAASGQVYFWPKNFTVAAYQELLMDRQFFQSFGISVLRVLIGVLMMLIVCIPLAYALSKSVKTFHSRNIYLWILILTMLFNGGLVATYLWIKNLGLLDTMWVLTLPYSVPVFSVLVLMNYMKTLSIELEEAALIDGASPFIVLSKIIVPLSKPAVATIALLSIVGHWNDYFSGRIYINTMTKQPLQTYIYSLSTELNAATMIGMSPEEVIAKMRISSLTFNAAKVVVATIPVLLIYPYLQKYFVKGLTLGGVKE